jgi:hypothetical protein
MSGAIMANSIVAIAAILISALAISALTMGTAPAVDWESYKPFYSPGSENDDWWIKYPDQSALADTSVKHPSWILEALKDKPVLILDHITYCKDCPVQKARIEEALDGYSEDVAFFDLLAEGDDMRAFEALQAYSPTGGESYVPTTVFITLLKGPDGKVSVAWHSEEGIMSEEENSAYLTDAIYYHRINAPQWNQ